MLNSKIIKIGFPFPWATGVMLDRKLLLDLLSRGPQGPC